ncbi:MAG: ImmA/IrrE family metallo-endopeptidase [Candidatus Rokubacteria bacterium]|nr:ImmA/IrrE family metallo-endopeptidase [Candidatus Rokubacteria bacterium]
MSPRSVLAEVNPAILRWARETAGLELEQVAKRFGKVEEWEREHGQAKPTVRQLETLSDIYKRPLATFFLPEPPVEPPPPTDFRMLPSDRARTLSKKVRLAMRKARRTQRLYTQLSAELTATHPRLPRIGMSDPERQARQIRGLLGIPIENQLSWRDSYDAFRGWRAAMEALGVLVLQLPMPVKEGRGFSLDEGSTPTIVVSSSDAITARIFTLFHELAHLLLNRIGLCTPDPTSPTQPSAQIEQFCNHFAGALLVPLDAVRAEGDLTQLPSSLGEMEERLVESAKAFKVSRYVILRRLLIANYMSLEQFRRMMNKWAKEGEPTQRRGGGQRPPARVLSQLGGRFVSLVLEAHGRGLITSSDVTSYLSLNLKYLGDVQRLVAHLRG